MSNPSTTPRPRDPSTGRFLPSSSSPLPAKSSALSMGSAPGYATQGYQGADWSTKRGFPFWPQLDTRFEITPYTRIESMRRYRLLDANGGFMRRLTEGAAMMVAGSGLEYHPTTSDKEWNQLARAAFRSRAGSALVFDVGGRFNFYKSQALMLKWSYGDGDCGAALTEAESGRARLAFYEGHQMGSGTVPEGEQKLWNDGVRVDPATNRPLAYRILESNGPAGFSSIAQTDIPAQDFIYFGEYRNNGQTRCISRCHHALNHIFDRAETTAFIKEGIKLASSIGMAVETDVGGANPKAPGMDAVLGTRTKVAAYTDSNGVQQSVSLEQLYGGGSIPRLQPGQKLRIVTDARPTKESAQFLDETLIRECAWGFGLPPEVIWNIVAVGGAGARFVLAAAQQWIEAQQQFLIDTYCARTAIFTIAKEMKYGGLRPCRDPQWWKHQWITPPRISVDFGKDGALYLKQLGAGALTYKRLYGWQSLDSEEELNQHLDETKFILDGLKSRGIELKDYLALRADGSASARVAMNETAPADPQS